MNLHLGPLEETLRTLAQHRGDTCSKVARDLLQEALDHRARRPPPESDLHVETWLQPLHVKGQLYHPDLIQLEPENRGMQIELGRAHTGPLGLVALGVRVQALESNVQGAELAALRHPVRLSWVGAGTHRLRLESRLLPGNTISLLEFIGIMNPSRFCLTQDEGQSQTVFHRMQVVGCHKHELWKVQKRVDLGLPVPL